MPATEEALLANRGLAREFAALNKAPQVGTKSWIGASSTFASCCQRFASSRQPFCWCCFDYPFVDATVGKRFGTFRSLKEESRGLV
jgi:hypothetical protein